MKLTFANKAKENIEAAELLYDSQKYNACANRAYYAAFQAAIAALVHAGITFDRISHEALQGKYSGELIRRRKIYPNKFRSYLMDLQSVRDDADYDLIFVSKKVAGRQVKKAKEFVAAIEKEIFK
jgi:uncharacterized protein (UPF0332 family)